jgi:hypothetical protein
VLTHDPIIYADITRGTKWSTARSGAFSKKMDNYHANKRLNAFAECMEDWLQIHPDATDEQIKASAKRFAVMIGSNPSFFELVRLTISLSKRTDLQTSL